MQRPPHPPNESVLARGLGTYMLWVGLLLGGVCAGARVAAATGAATRERRVADDGLHHPGLSQMGNALAVRSERESLFKHRACSATCRCCGAVLLTFVLQMAVVYVPFMQRIFGTQALTLGQFLLSLALSSIVFIAVELSKLLRRWRERKAAEAA